jgi:AAA15 family ATPase/GTPase
MLNSLEVKNFRILEDFKVSKLGRVNLIVGKNNSGKSSVLEALRIYAGNANRELLEKIAKCHDETYRLRENEQVESDIQLPFEDFFFGRQFPQDETLAISIGELAPSDSALRIEHGFLIEETTVQKNLSGETIERSIHQRRISNPSHDDLSSEVISHALFVTKGARLFSHIQLEQSRSPRLRYPPIKISRTLPCSVIPTQFISIDDLADEWDKIALTEHEEIVKQALRIITPEFESLTFVRNDEDNRYPRQKFSRLAKVKMSDSPHPVPLNSLGDGMLRVLQLVLKVFPAKGGFLLIDEFENGLHFSVQEKVWKLLFEMAQRLDIQVFATTHSWDCIESFAKAAIARRDVEGVLFRVGRSVKESNRGKVIATVFDEDALYSITQADVEVR